MLSFALLATSPSAAAEQHINEVVYLPGHDKRESYTLPQPSSYVDVEALPDSFNWGSVNGTNYLTKSLNQHIPQCELPCNP